jgi:hypothetical protein
MAKRSRNSDDPAQAPAISADAASGGEPAAGGSSSGGGADATANPPAPYPQRQGIIETLDSVVVAFILAFVFRAFVVEAFVIPTGSMAPTLYGRHGTIVCEDCGTEFGYGLADGKVSAQCAIDAGDEAICPNCRHANSDLEINDYAQNAEAGDRILVLKWPFDLGLESLGPQRWEVVVFKDTTDMDPHDGLTNYIKRLVGMPNEVLMLLEGDVYRVPAEKLSPEAVQYYEDLRGLKHEFRLGLRHGRLPQTPGWLLDELDQKLEIVRKTDLAQEVLWFREYDHDFLPRELDGYQPHWVAGLGPGSPWHTDQRRITFDSDGEPETTDYIELQGTDFRADYAYNISRCGLYSGLAPAVGDLRLRFVMVPVDGTGELKLRLNKRGVTHWAAVSMDGSCALYEGGNVPTEQDTPMVRRQLSAFPANEPVEVSFANVDYRLSLKINGVEVLASTDKKGDAAFYGPDVAAIRTERVPAPLPPRVAAQGGSFHLAHLIVDRDIYYRDVPPELLFSQSSVLSWATNGGWAAATNPILLGPGEYFMLGDNSPGSNDSRLWFAAGPHLNDRGEAFQLGTVPRDQLIGRAFFVYWPSGNRPDIPWLERWGFIPDVGRMRWIR